jgi:hypothetical protein
MGGSYPDVPGYVFDVLVSAWVVTAVAVDEASSSSGAWRWQLAAAVAVVLTVRKLEGGESLGEAWAG